MLKAYLNFFGCLIVAIKFLSGSECQYFIVFDGVHGIECFAIEISSATQNRLKISDGQGQMTIYGFVKYCESSVLRLIFSGSKFNCPIISDIHALSIDL